MLGALRRGPRHGYLVRREAVLDQTDAWTNIKPGSIYNALHRMHREGLVEAVASEQAAGPARTVFGLTDHGRSALQEQIRRSLAESPIQADPFDVALRLADELESDDRGGLLGDRRDALAKRVQVHETTLREVRQHLTGWEALAFEHVVARLRFELSWMDGLLAGDENDAERVER